MLRPGSSLFVEAARSPGGDRGKCVFIPGFRLALTDAAKKLQGNGEAQTGGSDGESTEYPEKKKTAHKFGAVL